MGAKWELNYSCVKNQCVREKQLPSTSLYMLMLFGSLWPLMWMRLNILNRNGKASTFFENSFSTTVLTTWTRGMPYEQRKKIHLDSLAIEEWPDIEDCLLCQSLVPVIYKCLFNNMTPLWIYIFLVPAIWLAYNFESVYLAFLQLSRVGITCIWMTASETWLTNNTGIQLSVHWEFSPLFYEI